MANSGCEQHHMNWHVGPLLLHVSPLPEAIALSHCISRLHLNLKAHMFHLMLRAQS